MSVTMSDFIQAAGGVMTEGAEGAMAATSFSLCLPPGPVPGILVI